MQASAIGFYRGDHRDMATVLSDAQVARDPKQPPTPLISDEPEFRRLQQGLYRAGREDPTLPMQIIERERRSHAAKIAGPLPSSGPADQNSRDVANEFRRASQEQ
jgi:hypothetical protein